MKKFMAIRDELYKNKKDEQKVCSDCGKEISEEEYNYSGMCENCYNNERAIMRTWSQGE